MVAASCLLVERAPPIPAFRTRRRVWIRAVRQAPLGELPIVVFHGDVEKPPRSESVATHVDHRPVRICPVALPAGAMRMVVDLLEEPAGLAAGVDEVDVV